MLGHELQYSAHTSVAFMRKVLAVKSVVFCTTHYDDVIMTTMASQITNLTVVYSIVYLGADQRKHQSSASLAFVWGIHRTGEFPAQRASNAENASIWWRHHGYINSMARSAVWFIRYAQDPKSCVFDVYRSPQLCNWVQWEWLRARNAQSQHG